MALFVLTKMPYGLAPTVLLLVKVVAFGFHVAFEQNFG
jgi:hypothetical protein